jgi:hypothetical protein
MGTTSCLLSRYCTLVINPAPLVTCDTFAGLEATAELQKGHDRVKISADNCLFWYTFGLKVVNFEETDQQSLL